MYGISPQQKEGSSKKEKKKKKEQGLKSNKCETSYEKLPISKGEKKTRMKLVSYRERFY
jgi:hypothetical protein